MIIYNHNIYIANIHVYFLEPDLLFVFTAPFHQDLIPVFSNRY